MKITQMFYSICVLFVLKINPAPERAGLLRTEKIAWWETLRKVFFHFFFIKKTTFGLKVS